MIVLLAFSGKFFMFLGDCHLSKLFAFIRNKVTTDYADFLTFRIILTVGILESVTAA